MTGRGGSLGAVVAWALALGMVSDTALGAPEAAGTVSDTAVGAPERAVASAAVSDTMGADSVDTTPGKPTAPIGIEAVFAAPPAVAVPLVVTIAVTPGPDLAGALLTLTTQEPLVLIEPQGEIALGDIAAGETVDVVVTVLPLGGGTHYLGVTVTGAIGGELQWRSIAIPIRLPDPQAVESGETATGKSDETVRSFEAVETVR